MKNLTVLQLESRLTGLNGWRVKNGKLHKIFMFNDFVTAFGFMARVALLAEKVDHHPDWSNSYRKVMIDLVTDSTGGITQLDIELAVAIDTLG